MGEKLCFNDDKNPGLIIDGGCSENSNMWEVFLPRSNPSLFTHESGSGVGTPCGADLRHVQSDLKAFTVEYSKIIF